MLFSGLPSINNRTPIWPFAKFVVTFMNTSLSTHFEQWMCLSGYSLLHSWKQVVFGMFIDAMLSSDSLHFAGLLRAVKFVFRTACERRKVKLACERNEVNALRVHDDANPMWLPSLWLPALGFWGCNLPIRGTKSMQRNSTAFQQNFVHKFEISDPVVLLLCYLFWLFVSCFSSFTVYGCLTLVFQQYQSTTFFFIWEASGVGCLI
jgi:hypothetical protein